MRSAAIVPAVLAILLALPCSLPAEDGQEAPSDVQVNKFMEAKAYAKAEAMCRDMLAKDPTDQGAEYNLACALAREGKTDAAIAALGKSADLGFDDGDHARVDDDLVSLHGQPQFQVIVKSMQDHQAAAHQKAMQGIAFEPGAPIDGVATVEGDPATGLRWRLHMGKDATAAKPERLVVWLHPSGGSANAIVEPLATDLTHHGFALAVFTQKQFLSWTPEEMNKIWASVLDIGKTAGVDARKPVLMGFSAGGQAALMCWSGQPDWWSALLLDAAYPIDMGSVKGNQVSALPLTPAMRAAKTPILALVGGTDGGSQLWQAIGPAWVKAGQPVELHVVPGKGHEFLFKGDEWQATLKFLDALKPLGKVKKDAHPGGGSGDSQLP
jgi:predicted esterase